MTMENRLLKEKSKVCVRMCSVYDFNMNLSPI